MGVYADFDAESDKNTSEVAVYKAKIVNKKLKSNCVQYFRVVYWKSSRWNVIFKIRSGQMKKQQLWRRLAAGALAGLLVFSSVPASAQAEGEGAAETTIYGKEETVTVGDSAGTGRAQDFNKGWKFYLGKADTAYTPNFDDSSWTAVTLPHDFSIMQSFTASGEAESGFLPGGVGWYRKSFTMPESAGGRRVILNFDGVYSDAYVYVNGAKVGEHHYGYTAFSFDISEYLTCDGTTENVIAVQAINNIPSSRWYSGSGIYRDVTLDVVDPVHVDLNGTRVTTPDIANTDSSDRGNVAVSTEIKNDGDTAAEVTVRNTVYTSDGTQASGTHETTVSVGAGQTVTAEGSTVVSEPQLWSVETPNRYYVRTEILADGEEVDTYDTDFGFRWFAFDRNTGFSLNGENVKLNGVCMHHDQGALGSAAYYDAMYRQLSIMKDMGVNAIRTSHNPADKQFIEICDELGLMVIEEFFDGWSLSKNGNSNDFGKYFEVSLGDNEVLGGDSAMTWAEFTLKSTVRRDRNDPSVILWSLGNEIQEGAWESPDFPAIAQDLIDWTKEEDTTRPTTIGSNRRTTIGTLGSVHSVVANNGGIVGFNYASQSELASMNSAYGPIIASETSSAVNSRGIYNSQANASNADGKYHLTSYDTSKVSWGKTAHDSMWDTLTLDYVAGEFVWTGFDYIGEPTPWNGTGTGDYGRGAIPNSSYFGIVETTGFAKDTYYLYRSQWNQKDTTLHLITAWDSDNMLTSGGKTPVVIYSNAPKVELYRNGTQIGTAIRTVHTTAAGHTYYTYAASGSDSSVCTAVSASGSASLYATFYVAYEAGTISAKAYDEDGKEITDVKGSSSVSTPDTVSKLKAEANRTEADADGSSLTYISVDVTDEKGNPDTTATNTIRFSLSGNGEIAGVDNGDQATTAKYQQPAVLTGTTSAQIAAYAGKALVIVRSTEEAGSFTVNVTADGLTGGSVTVNTKEVSQGTVSEGLASYTMVRDYTVKAGTAPKMLTTAVGAMADGSEVAGTITWDAISEEIYSTPGDHTIKGTLRFDGLDPVSVTCRLHVIGNVIAMRNISTATTPGTIPELSDKVRGVLADGTLSGEFSVVWEEMTAEQFAAAGDIVIMNGTATVLGDETLPVTASVRVAEAVNTESINVAPAASGLTQDIASDKQSDNLESIKNGTTKPGDNTSERWSNWNNRTTSATAALTFQWDTAQLLSSVNLCYYYDNCAAKPESVAFEYSLDGQTFTAVNSTEELIEEYSLGAEYSYTFEKTVNPIALRVILTQQDGTTGNHCVALTEAEIMTYAGKLVYNSSAALGSIQVDGAELADFAADTFAYTVAGAAVTGAASDSNAGITILPELDRVVRILTVSEDGSESETYAVTLEKGAACGHAHTELRNAKEAACTADGYTGDTWCTDCGIQISAGEVIPAAGHKAELRNVKEASCTENGYTGDEVCTVCGETVRTGRTIPAKGHTYDDGTVTKEPTMEEEGIRTYTCTVCGAAKTETIPKLTAKKEAPKVTVSAKQGASEKIALTGKVEDYENIDHYYDITAHGLVYYSAAKLGTRNLTVNTPGRTRVNFSGYKEDGSFTYSMKPAYASTCYVVRAFAAYTDEDGRTIYAYSSPLLVSYNSVNSVK